MRWWRLHFARLLENQTWFQYTTISQIGRLSTSTYLHAGFRQGRLGREALPRGHAGVVALLELLLELLELVGAEGGPVSAELGLLGAVEAGVVLVVGVGARGRTEKTVVGVRRPGRAGGAGHHGRPGPRRLQTQRAVGPQGRMPREGGGRRRVRVRVVQAITGSPGEFRCGSFSSPVSEYPVDAAH